MMANELIRPIDAETARAIEEASKAASKAVDLSLSAGRYAATTVGDLPQDLIGMLGDWVKHIRYRRWQELTEETDRILHERGVKNREHVSPSVAIPLIEAAVNEDREGLKQLWAKLLATAMDPDRASRVRPSLIELLKKMDPLDARVMEQMAKGVPAARGQDLSDVLGTLLGADRDEVFFSLQHLHELGCLAHNPESMPRPQLSAKARLLLKALAD